MQRVERIVYADDRGAGCAYTAIGVGVGATAGAMARTPVIAVATTSAGRELRMAATRVRDELRGGDVPRARMLLPALVGRDPSVLDEPGIAAAVVESLAENSVDP